jgi:hypothetical protein
MSAKSNDDGSVEQSTTNQQPTLSRRRALQGLAVAGSVVATGVGPASARTGDNIGGIDYSSDLAPDPEIMMSFTVSEHVGGEGDLSFTDDSGETRSLKTEGFVLQVADRDADPMVAENPVTISAKNIKAEEYDKFPRGATFEDADGDEQDLDWYDKQHWSTSGLSLTEGAGSSLQLTASAGGDSATLSDGVNITSGVDRKVLQLVLDLDGGSLDIEIEDSTGSVATETVSSTGDSIIVQTRIGDLGTTLDDISKVRFKSPSGSTDGEIYALNLDRDSEWEYGEEQYLDTSGDEDELDTQAVDPSSGTFSIKSLDTLPDYFRSADIENKQLDVRHVARELPMEDVWIRAPDMPDVSSYDKRLEIFYQFTTPSVYDIDSVTRSSVEYETGWPGDRYNVFETISGASRIDLDDSPDWEDDVESMSGTDQTGSIGSAGSETTLISSPSDTGTLAFRIEIPMSTDRLSTLESSSFGGAAVATSGGSGPLGGVLPPVVSNNIAAVGGVLTAAAVYWRSTILSILWRS